MRIALGSDHAGFELKSLVAGHLVDLGHQVDDLGTTDGTTSVDYPDFGAAVGRAVVSGSAELGVAICGTGIGISIAANKVPGVRAALVNDVTTATLAKQHNDANVLCLGARVLGTVTALDALDAFLATAPEARHHARLEKIAVLDGSSLTNNPSED